MDLVSIPPVCVSALCKAMQACRFFTLMDGAGAGVKLHSSACAQAAFVSAFKCVCVYMYAYVCLQMRRCSNPYWRGCLFLGNLVILRLEGFLEVVSGEMHICRHQPIRSREAEAVRVLQKAMVRITACPKAHRLPQALC